MSIPIHYNLFLYTNPKICKYSNPHLPYFISTVLLLVIFLGLPTLLLCLYPTNIFRKLFSHCLPLRWQQGLSAFIDTFQGHYKDGTDGTRDYRAASSIHLLVIFFIIVVCNGRNRRLLLLEYVQPFFVAVSLFYALARPCKQDYANRIQSLLYAITALVMISISSLKSHNHIFLSLLLMFLCLLTPHVVLISYIFYKVIGKTRLNHFCLQKLCIKFEQMKEIIQLYMHHSPYPNEHSPLKSSV